MKNAKRIKETIEKYLSKKLSEKEFGNIIDREETVLNINKMLDDLKSIKETRVLILYSFNLIDILLTIGLRQDLFKYNIDNLVLNSKDYFFSSNETFDFNEDNKRQFVRRCSKVIDDILEKMSFNIKREHAKKIFDWDEKISKIVSEFQRLRNNVAHRYYVSHQEFLKKRKEFQYVLFNKRSIIKNITYLLESDFINTES